MDVSLLRNHRGMVYDRLMASRHYNPDKHWKGRSYKKGGERVQALRERVETAVPPPRYDDVYEAGVAWLDSLAFDEEPEKP